MACVTSRDDGKTGSLEEFERLMLAGGIEPVQGQVSEEVTSGEHASGELPEAQEPSVEDLVRLAAEAEAAKAKADAQADAVQPEPEPQAPPEESPYIRFGERIQLHDVDGQVYVTKIYSLPEGRPQKVVDLMGALGPFGYRERPKGMGGEQVVPLDPAILEYQILSKFEIEPYLNLRSIKTVPAPVAKGAPSDLMVVTAIPDLLEEFEDFLDLFVGGGVPQVELEAKIIEIVSTKNSDYGGSGSVLFGSTNLVRSLGVSLPNFSDGTEAILTLGAIQDQAVFNGVIEAIQGWQNVTIDSKPKTVVRAGGVASIETLLEIPFLSFKTLDASGNFTTTTQYKKVGTSFFIGPRMVGSNTLALDILVENSQQVGSQGIISVGGTTSEVPIIAYRTAKTVVHLKPGQTLVIGGLTQTRDQTITNRVPILGSIPLLGWLFRSEFKSVQEQTVIFAISARMVESNDYQHEF